jgi:integrase/recombinase XerC
MRFLEPFVASCASEVAVPLSPRLPSSRHQAPASPARVLAFAAPRHSARVTGPISPAGANIETFDLDLDWLARLAPLTAQTYRAALAHCARWLGCPAPALPAALFGRGPVQAARTVRRYQAFLLARAYAPATINTRVAALRSLVDAARAAGAVNWHLDVGSVRSTPYRDMRGPTLDGIQALISATARSRGARRQARDFAIVRVAVDLALRRGEMSELTIAAVERDARGGIAALWVLGKGRRERERVPVPRPTAEALDAWLSARGTAAGSLFGLTPGGIAKVVGRLGVRAGAATRVSPHRLRHASISLALVACPDPRQVRFHSRHADIATVLRYDDARNRGAVSALVADAVGAGGAEQKRCAPAPHESTL